MKKRTYPIVLESGSERVVVRKISDHGRPAFRIEYNLDGRRKSKDRADEKEAHLDAKRILNMLLDRAPIFAESEDSTIYRAAQTVLRGVGVPVDVAAREYVSAIKRLGGMSLDDAVSLALKARPPMAGNVPGLVENFLVSLQLNAAPEYFDPMRTRLNRFARSFPGPIADIKKSAIEEWLVGLALAPRTRNNERATLVTFFRWARDEEFLPRGVEVEPQFLKRAKTINAPEILTVAQTAKIMERVAELRPALVPYAAIGLFAGVRPKEMKRLRFEDIRWNHNDIEVSAANAKTGGRRLVDMKPNLKVWLAPFANKTGPLTNFTAEKMLIEIAADLGIKWVPDIMRHSFISYAVAAEQQIGQVALWAGNSEHVIKTNYLKMVTPDEAVAFFGIEPAAESKLIHFAGAA